MAIDKDSHVSSDRQKWQKIFNALVHMLQTQQTQVESLAKERKLLEDRIKFQYDRWISDVHSLQDQIAQMEMKFTVQEKERLVEAAKSDLLMGLKKREVSLCKLKLESTDDELVDFKVLIDFLSHECLDPNDDYQGISKVGDKEKGSRGDNNLKSVKTTKEEEQCAKRLEGEVRKLKWEYENLASRNSAEVSALLAEQNFVWNQYKIMESNYSNKLNSKHVEVEQANEKIDNLLVGMEQLESLNNEKDDKIVKLKTDLAKMETETKKKNEEISRLSKEVELLRKSRSASVTPILNRCTEKQKTSGQGKNKSWIGRNISIKKETPASEKNTEKKKESSVSEKNTEKKSRGSKRKEINVTPTSETPRLFTSTFKIPKLKNSSPQIM
ncbi:hypothetical protein VitviT2T_027882 [Vitis vinifera]|uniref:Uncharacterized protein n=1 Tax=Vitis vinifera TaxID=29760 RepID=A0ABY9DV78_VITVI|nr:intracellular protein transport protein USO1 isoform X1 [Vitis vinifera]WKA10306.1 hypothetical protein VitviT2T_027882 [Vitis vinifera]|eukprot:XP_010664812.1 PREDICTED: intracellular protein transport protein USO1 isoform X1 [Vitis vinifera]